DFGVGDSVLGVRDVDGWLLLLAHISLSLWSVPILSHWVRSATPRARTRWGPNQQPSPFLSCYPTRRFGHSTNTRTCYSSHQSQRTQSCRSARFSTRQCTHRSQPSVSRTWPPC